MTTTTTTTAPAFTVTLEDGVATLLLDVPGWEPESVEDLPLRRGVVDADAATPDLETVQHEVVRASLRGLRRHVVR